MSKFNKRNKATEAPFNSKKIPSNDSSGSTEGYYPYFSFEKMQPNTGYSVGCVDKDNKAALAGKLYDLSQITWAQIRASGRHQLGHEIINRASIKAPLPPLTDDVNILAFRFNGKASMLGYREGRIFHVLLLDWKFDAYPHN